MRVTVSLPEQGNEYQALQTEEARATAERLGLEIEVLYAENSGILQIQQVLRAIRSAEKPVGVVIEPVTPDGLTSVSRKIVAAQMGLAVLNCTAPYLDDLRAQNPELAIFTVSSDQVEIGRIQGRQVLALLPSGGTVLVVHGSPGSRPAQERFAGFNEVVGTNNGVRVISVYGLWTEASAEHAVRSWLSLASAEKSIDIVAAQDDSMARGARRAVEAVLGPKSANIVYLGIDGVPSVGQKMVQEGRLAATVIMPSNTGAALEHMVRWRQSGTVPASVSLAVRSFPPESELVQRAIKTA
jgi:simple sugar transport system substrate-binding protein